MGLIILSEHLLKSWQAIQARVAETYLARRVTEAYLRARGRVQLARFDQLNAARSQTNTLLGLVHRAQATRFGIDHDFRRIRNEEDFRRLVPVTTAAALARTYWQAGSNGSTWPAPVVGLASYEVGERSPRQVLLTPASLRARRQAIHTALSFVLDAHPLAQLLSGSLLFLGGPTQVFRTAKRTVPTPEEMLRSSVPALYRPYLMTADAATGPDAFLQRSLLQPLTCVCGSLVALSRFFDRAKTFANRDKVSEIWPNLLAVLCHNRPADRGLIEPLRRELGPRVSLLEMGRFPEGIVAVEDPRYGLPRLLPAHGLYYEFVPVAESDRRTPQRLSLAQVQVGVAYELLVTSPAGIWACRVGAAVCFERLDPPLVRFVELPRTEAAPPKRELFVLPAKDTPPTGLKVPPPHRQSAGTPAAPPESFAHNPWLVPVDRG